MRWRISSIYANTRTQSKLTPIRVIWACLLYSKAYQAIIDNRIAQPYADTIRVNGLCLLYAFPIILSRWALFAIHKTPYMIQSSSICCAHFAQLSNRDNRQIHPNQAKSEHLQRIGIAWHSRTQSHDSKNGNAGRHYKASIYPYRSNLYNPPALARCYHNRRVSLIWPRFKALSLLSCFALLPLPLYSRLNASRIAWNSIKGFILPNYLERF